MEHDTLGWSLSSDCFDFESFNYGVRIPMTHFHLPGEAAAQGLLFNQKPEAVTSETAAKHAALVPSECESCHPREPQNRRRVERQKEEQRLESSLVNGRHCSVQKHLGVGCAIVRFQSETQRAKLLAHVQHQNLETDGTIWLVDNRAVHVTEYFDKQSGRCEGKCLFMSWRALH
eukprot:TRINITY_DN30361_c0_g1_i1.p1 TRINITY_DN30361_c0_g1~~TRINITY_DN30361_c0_g1_i1.p1  ORF type:complete len:174 (+),score=10.51 TRINITY_DN30361_c0_g1_i1:60-581(+)